jgi:hypothetical protein
MDTLFAQFVHPMILPFYAEVLLDDGGRVAHVRYIQGGTGLLK